MGYAEEARLQEVVRELVRLLRDDRFAPTLDYLPPLPAEGARRVVVGLGDSLKMLLDLTEGRCRVFRQVAEVPMNLTRGYRIGRLSGLRRREEARLKQVSAAEKLAESLLDQIQSEYYAGGTVPGRRNGPA